MAKKSQRMVAVVAITALLLALVIVGQGMADNGLTPKEELGEFLYFDENLSEPNGQACASCHEPAFGFVDPDSDLPVSEGVLPLRVGNRNSPASAYAMYAPIRFIDDEGLYVGGQFWDSRATGHVLGDPLADQALGPFLNPVEMANPVKRTVINSIKQSDYAELFEAVWGEKSLKDTELAYDRVALSIAAFERTALFGQFSSQYDYYLQECLENGGDKDDCARGIGTIAAAAGEQVFDDAEWNGLQLFMDDEDGGAKCVLCHVADWTEDPGNVVVPDWSPDGTIPPLFTDFTYDNLGVPKNWDNPFLYLPPNLNPDGADFVDLGLGPVVGDPAENGKFKVMTLRNIGLTAPYAHNGLFKTLKEITHFYNTRDVIGEGWDTPEVPETINTEELGDLGLTPEQEDLLVEFMMTLNDGGE